MNHNQGFSIHEVAKIISTADTTPFRSRLLDYLTPADNSYRRHDCRVTSDQKGVFIVSVWSGVYYVDMSKLGTQ